MEGISSVNSHDELVTTLRQLGIAGAREAAVIKGFVGAFDAAIMFQDAAGEVRAVEFSTHVVPIDEAHQVMTTLTVLAPMHAGGRRRPDHHHLPRMTKFRSGRPINGFARSEARI